MTRVEDIITDYRNEQLKEMIKLNPGLSMYSAEELEMMFPLTKEEKVFIVHMYISSIEKEIILLNADIKDCENRIDDPKVFYEAKTECRHDITICSRKIRKLENEIDEVKKELSKLEGKERHAKRNRKLS